MAVPLEPQVGPRIALYWIPLGAGARVVRISGWAYEALAAAAQRRHRQALYHSALITVDDRGSTVIEMAPTPDLDGADRRGVVATGPVGSRLLGRWRLFRYEVRRWPGGLIPDLGYAVESPVVLSTAPADIDAVLSAVAGVPAPVWGRDELRVGDMWNSNSVISWTLARTGLLDAAGGPPQRGRAPGWDAGVAAARGSPAPKRTG